MNIKDYMLGCLYCAKGEYLSPVQVQKLFFILDKNISTYVDGPFFNFEAYNYGPFDKAVYEYLNLLEAEDYVDIDKIKNWNQYRLTTRGQILAGKVFENFPENVKNYVQQAVDFVKSLSFADLVAAIYKAYPEMKVNSIFQG